MEVIGKKGIVISAICAFALNLGATDLGTVQVESSTIDLNTDVATEVSNVDVIDEEMVQTVGAKNLVEVLKTVPGVTAVARAGEQMQIRFRGVGQQQFMGEQPGVAIIVDGVPIKSKAGGFRINMTDIKSIKVIKGSASYLYGDGALSGTLIITTKRPKGKNETVVTAEVGSYKYQEYTIGTTQSTENFGINLNATSRSTDGYWTDSELWTRSINGKASYYIDDTSDITFAADFSKKFDEAGSRSTVGGVTAAEENPKGTGDDGYTKDSGIDLDKFYLTYTKDFDNIHFTVTGYNYKDLYDDTSNPQNTDGNTSTPNVYVKHSNQDLKQQGLKSELSIDSESFGGMIGLEYGKRDDITESETLADYSAYSWTTKTTTNYYAGETSHTNSKDTVKALYGELKYNFLPNLTTTVNARYNVLKKEYVTEKHDYNGTVWSDTVSTDSATFKNTAYRVGATYNLNKAFDLFASVSTGFQNPDAEDLAESPDLKEQTSINYEIGSRGVIDTPNTYLKYELSIYQLDNKDILGPVGGTYAFSDPQDNIGDSRSRGLELSLSSDETKQLSFILAYTYLNAFYTAHNPQDVIMYNKSTVTMDVVGNDLPRTSKHTVDLFLNYYATEKLKFISEVYAKSSYYADEMNLVKFKGYSILNLQARYYAKLFGNNLEMWARIDNFFDNQYFRSALLHKDSRGIENEIDPEDASITVDPGRVFYVGLKYTF
ncbi:TonB-dependent receptor [Sulfurimonas sp.]|uniref:TonB-dependent receptor n=1 Tax=Sulfurimonas sp. TaxID=2022749 RepID=UPI003D0ADC2D